jgi:hypothetical protein
MIVMKHNCDNCKLPIGEVGRLEKIHTSKKKVIWLCVNCKKRK